MPTRNLVPRNSGEGGVGRIQKAWASGVFDNLYIRGVEFSMDQSLLTTDAVEFSSGNFPSGLTVGGVDVTGIQAGGGAGGSVAEFCFFSDVVDNQGVISKIYYDTPGTDVMLSGITVATAEDLKIYFRWDGPNDDYIGTASINGQQIPFNNIQQLGSYTRRFEGFIDNLNLTGLTGITGEANGRTSILPLTELGLGPVPTNILIDEISNATAKPGEELGTTDLKQGDTINIYVDFDRQDVDLIKIHDYGLAQEIDYTNYTLQDIGGGTYRATIPVTVSNRNGDLSVAVQAIDDFGSTGDLKESSDFSHTSGSRTLDQTYPSISATDPTTYNGRTDGLREGESTTFTNSISNWSTGTDYISYTALTSDISIANTGIFESTKTVNYVTGIYNNSDNVEIYVLRTNNGATDTENVNVKIANGPVIVSTQLDSLASSATAPHITGSSQIKDGDVVNSKIEINGKGVGINDISISVANAGVSDGSQTSYSSSYLKTTLVNGNFEFTIPINVYGPLGSTARDGLQTATFTARNNFGTLSDSATTTDTAEVHNATFPEISFGSITYPSTQQAIKATESATVSNTVNHFDIISYTSPNNQLSISNTSTYETNKNVDYSSGGYNVDIDGGQNNITITATRTANGTVSSNSDIVNIANTPLTISINNLAAKIKTSTSPTSDNFNLTTSQLMLSAPTLSVDSNQTNPSSLSQTASGTGKLSNAYSLTVTDSDTKGTFNWNVSATNLAGIVTTSILTNPTYTLEGFTSRTIVASPTSLGAGLAPVGTTVTNGNNITFENVSEGGTAPNGGTIYTYQSYADGIQLDNTYDVNNKFTVCDSNGVTDADGNHVFNLDKLNRAANTSTSNPATFVLSE